MLKNGRLWLVIVITFLILLVFGFLGASFYRDQVYQAADPFSEKTISVIIEKGESGGKTAKRLQDLGLIKSALFFRIYLRFFNPQSNQIQAGEYDLSPAMSLAQIVQELSHGTFDVRLTFIEGWRKEEYAFYLFKNFGEEFASEFLNDPQAQEGYLFPDTYLVSQKIEASELVSLLRSNFDQKVDENLRSLIEAQGLTFEQGITLASIIEREAKREEDRPLVVDILIKRLKNGWPLEADATTQYAKANVQCPMFNVQCDWWSKELTGEDLNLDSPFNTRKVSGLPPSPIANPGLSAIYAVAHPQESEYWYYLSDENSKIHYSQTLEQHNQKILEFLH